MNRDVPLKKYAKKMNHSYTFGAFPTIELLKNQPEHVLKVLLHPDMNSETQLEIITDLCNRHNIPIERAAKVVEKLRDKENIFAVGVFEKYTNQLDPTADHIVLVNRVIWGIWERSSDKHRFWYRKSCDHRAGCGCI